MLKKENAIYRRKILACTLAVSTITGSIIMASGSNYASAVSSIEEIKNNQVGVCGVFTDNWGMDSDIPMNDDDGDGIWEAKIEFDVKEEYIADWYCDGEPTKEGSGIQFKIRLNKDWSDCWGNYDGRNGSYNSQYNYGIPASQVKVGNHVSFTAYLDTNRNDPLAIKDGAVDENDAPDYYYLAGGYKDLKVYPGFAGYEWEENDAGGITITQYYGDDKKAVIPSEIIGKPVTSIGGGAFSGCEELTSIDIPDSVKEIGYGAFSFCTGLTNITIPDSVTSIGEDAFEGCTGLTSITIPGSITSLGSSVFAECEKLTSIDIPDSVTSIGDSAFEGCTSLTSITIPGSVTSIGEYAFADCTGLKKLTIENGVTSIGDYAFCDCSGLTSITIPKSITSIGCSPFSECTGLTSINVDSDNEKYSSDENGVLFNKDKSVLTIYPAGKKGDYIIPDYVTSIGSNAFESCTALTNITIPDSVATIGSRAFMDCTALKNIIIPDSVTNIGNAAFLGCKGLTSIDIPDSVTEIKEWTFGNCTSLTKVNIGNGVTYIGAIAFQNCTGLTSIDIPDNVTALGETPFTGCENITTINIGSGLEKWWSSGLPKLTSINVSKENKTYSSDENGVLFDKNKTVLMEYPRGKQGAYIIPDSVTEILAGAFYECKGLTEVTIPETVKKIGTDAFTYYDYDTSWYKGLDIIIRGVTGSAAETYARENGITFVALDSEPVTDTVTKIIDDESKITVEGVLPDGVALKVNPLTVDKTKDPDVIASYDISLINDENAAVQPDGTIKISIPCDTKDCKVMWVKDNGTKTDMNAEYINGYYVFTTDHLSVYQIVKNTGKSSEVSDDETEVSNDKPATESEISSGNNDVSTGTDNPTDNLPQTGETGILFIPIVLIFCALIVIISVFRKRKHQ